MQQGRQAVVKVCGVLDEDSQAKFLEAPEIIEALLGLFFGDDMASPWPHGR